MKKKAQTFSFGIAAIIAIFIFLIGMMCINFIKDEVTRTRTGLDCTSTTISDGNKMMCLLTDVTVPYFILSIFSIAGGIITARLTL